MVWFIEGSGTVGSVRGWAVLVGLCWAWVKLLADGGGLLAVVVAAAGTAVGTGGSGLGSQGKLATLSCVNFFCHPYRSMRNQHRPTKKKRVLQWLCWRADCGRHDVAVHVMPEADPIRRPRVGGAKPVSGPGGRLKRPK